MNRQSIHGRPKQEVPNDPFSTSSPVSGRVGSVVTRPLDEPFRTSPPRPGSVSRPTPWSRPRPAMLVEQITFRSFSWSGGGGRSLIG